MCYLYLAITMMDDNSGVTVSHVKASRRGCNAGLLSYVKGGRPSSVKIMQVTGETIIGREPSCDIYIPDSRISRKHAFIQLEHSIVKLADLNSTNGTERNGEPVDGTIILNDGDRLILAGTHFFEVRVREEDETVKSLFLNCGQEGYLLTSGEVFIGSDPQTCDIVIPDPSLGQRHAQLEFIFGDVFMSCMDNDRGLTINNASVQCKKLEDISQIKIGAIIFSWKYLPDKDKTETIP